jgi:hypothetical protein
MTTRIPLQVVTAPAIGVVLQAPPVLKASERYCGSYNSTDA